MAGRKNPYQFDERPVDVGTDIGEWGCALMMGSATGMMLLVLYLGGFFG